MQSKSIPEPACAENERTSTPFPTSGDNFTTLIPLDSRADPFAFLEAVAFLQDVAVAYEAFEHQRTEEECTGTGNSSQ